MGMRVKIEDVARRAGVSIATVSLALNGDDRVSAKTRDRIEIIAREMNYQPNPNAKRLAMRKSRQIGLVVPDIENIYYAALAQHTLNELLPSDYVLTISTSMNSRRMERRIIDDMIGNQVEGLLIAPVEKPNDNVAYFENLRRSGIPYLFVTARYPNLRHPAVMCDLYGGMKQLLEVLYAQGYSRIALLSGTENAHCLELRDSAYVDFNRAHGLDARKLFHLNGVRYEDAHAFGRTMEVGGTDAIVCVNDMMALGLINALSERGIRVPEDVAVAGFDDSIFSRLSHISITTVRQDIQRMAVQAAQSILRLASGGTLDELQPIPCEVILRQSTEKRCFSEQSERMVAT